MIIKMAYMSDTRSKLVISIPLVFLFIIKSFAAKIDATVDYELEGDGFHRVIRYNVDTGTFFRKNCYIAIHLLPDPTLYVNVDELADLQRHGETIACSDGEIDVEVFAEEAGQQNVTTCAPLKESNNILSLPIHQRYLLPRENYQYVEVTLPKPVLLLGCRERIKEYTVSKLDLCSPCVDLSLKWREIPYRTTTKDYIWMVPVGNLSHLDSVTLLTLCVVFFGTVGILRTLWFTKSQYKA